MNLETVLVPCEATSLIDIETIQRCVGKKLTDL